MRRSAPGTRDYADLLRFIRADSLINEKYHKLISALTNEIESQFAEQGKDFDIEFAEWQAERYECTYIRDDRYDVKSYVCDNCGAHSESVHGIHHHDTCKKGESKKWEEVYSRNEEVM